MSNGSSGLRFRARFPLFLAYRSDDREHGRVPFWTGFESKSPLSMVRRRSSLKNTANSLPPLMLCRDAPISDATGLVTAAEKRGFCFNSALKTVEPERGRPEIM